MPLFGPLHLSLILLIAALCTALSFSCRRKLFDARTMRLTIGAGLILNELVWWTFRYSREVLHLKSS